MKAKQIKRLNKYVCRCNKAVQKFFKNIYKSLKTFKNDMKKIVFLFTLAAIIAACGSTKVSVDKPAAGTMTTITVTTNNPIHTNVNPNVELKTK